MLFGPGVDVLLLLMVGWITGLFGSFYNLLRRGDAPSSADAPERPLI